MSLGPPGTSDVLDMPVDPNEPTYCLCHQVRPPTTLQSLLVTICINEKAAVQRFYFQGATVPTKITYLTVFLARDSSCYLLADDTWYWLKCVVQYDMVDFSGSVIVGVHGIVHALICIYRCLLVK